MYDTNDLLRIIKQASVEAMEAKKPVNVVFGVVQSVSPIKIQVEQKLILDKDQLILSKNVTKHTISVTTNVKTGSTNVEYDFSHDHSFDLQVNDVNVTGTINKEELIQSVSHEHTINKTFNVIVNNELKNGDRVILIRMQEGQKYIVLDRIGG